MLSHPGNHMALLLRVGRISALEDQSVGHFYILVG